MISKHNFKKKQLDLIKENYKYLDVKELELC